MSLEQAVVISVLVGWCMLSCLYLYRNNRVFAIRQTIMASSHRDYDDLPTYAQMMHTPRYWGMWTTMQWLKWLERKRDRK